METPAISAPARMSRLDLLPIVLLLMVNTIWLLILPLPFIDLDDPWFITQNPYVVHGLSWESFTWAFTTSFGDYWHPLTWISLSLDATLFGPGPWGFHFTNMVLHIANAVLLFLFLRAATGSRWRSFVAAALFSLHPQRVESVAWVTERKDVLAGFFGMLALLAYLRAARSKGRARMVPVLFLFVCSFLSKPLFITMPVLLLLLDFWPLGRFRGVKPWSAMKGLVREKVPLFLLAGLGALNTYLYVYAKGSFRASPSVGLENAPVNYVLYVRDFFYPAWLALFYRARPTLPPWEFVGSALLLAAITVMVVLAAWRRWKYAPPLLVGWSWFVIAMLPTSGLLQPGYSMRGDRFMYIPTLGLIIALLWAAVPALRFMRRPRIAFAAAAVMVALSWCTVARLAWWRDPLTFAEHDLVTDPENAYLQESAGLAAARAHQDARADAHFQEAARLDPYDFSYVPPASPATSPHTQP